MIFRPDFPHPGAVWLLALALLAGCAREAPPAPVEFRSGTGPRISVAPAPAGGLQPMIPHPDRVKIEPGETLYAVSRRYGIPVRSIIDANHLQPPYRLAAGSMIVLPQLRVHVVRPGETLMSIARLYGVGVNSLATVNYIAPPYQVRSGETLVLPAAVEGARVMQAAAPPPVVPGAPGPPQVASLPPPERPPSPVVPSSEAASPPLPPAPPPNRLASREPAPAEAAPALDDPEVPPLPASPPPAPPPPRPKAPNAALAEPPKPSSPPPVPVAVPPPPVPAPASAPKEQSVAIAEPPPVSDTGFVWPVQGRILSAYGPQEGGTQNDGINIAAPEGTPVLAAAAGVVKYAGNELHGYGYLILIKHDDGFITAYAHNENLLVKRDERVKRGQIIARVGETGAVNEPQLHFEIRRGSRALDPTTYLPALKAATNG